MKMSVKKWSILGLVLIAASAVTAAVMPSKTAVLDRPGNHEDSTSPNDVSCVTKFKELTSCNVTDPSVTTVNGGGPNLTDGSSNGPSVGNTTS
jgi:hypothetical protein